MEDGEPSCLCWSAFGIATGARFIAPPSVSLLSWMICTWSPNPIGLVRFSALCRNPCGPCWDQHVLNSAGVKPDVSDAWSVLSGCNNFMTKLVELSACNPEHVVSLIGKRTCVGRMLGKLGRSTSKIQERQHEVASPVEQEFHEALFPDLSPSRMGLQPHHRRLHLPLPLSNHIYSCGLHSTRTQLPVGLGVLEGASIARKNTHMVPRQGLSGNAPKWAAICVGGKILPVDSQIVVPPVDVSCLLCAFDCRCSSENVKPVSGFHQRAGNCDSTCCQRNH